MSEYLRFGKRALADGLFRPSRIELSVEEPYAVCCRNAADCNVGFKVKHPRAGRHGIRQRIARKFSGFRGS